MAKEKTTTQKVKKWFEKLLPCCLKVADEALDLAGDIAEQAIKDKNPGKTGEAGGKIVSDLLHGLGDSLRGSSHEEVIAMGTTTDNAEDLVHN